jgi:shikimate dehydrogenase
MIDGRTQMVGLIGWPVEHSLSPTMHNAAFDALELNWRYVALPVPPGQVEAAVRGLAALGFRGANVTVPHKEAVVPLLDSIAPNARELGAVNTIVVERTAAESVVMRGHNTDDGGVISALRHGGYAACSGGLSVVVGAGGAARAVVHGLLRFGVGETVVLNRTLERAEALVSDLRPGGGGRRLRALELTPENLVEWALKADLLVNATTVGMWPRVDASVWPGSVPVPKHLTIFDLVYNPLETRLLQQVSDSGARAIGGVDMLVAQGAEAFELWTGRKAPLEVMRAACERALKG